jgi:hypothetical protein
MKQNNPFIYELEINNATIQSWTDFKSGKLISKLSKPLTGLDYKIYVLVENKRILYIGTTKRSLKSRLNSGLKADGKNGYHGYQWKGLKNVRILIWNFTDFDKKKIENVEAELAFVVRTQTGRWPELQNEIHFNNKFQEEGKKMANEMYNQILICD